jgi:hypothetical protein
MRCQVAAFASSHVMAPSFPAGACGLARAASSRGTEPCEGVELKEARVRVQLRIQPEYSSELRLITTFKVESLPDWKESVCRPT